MGSSIRASGVDRARRSEPRRPRHRRPAIQVAAGLVFHQGRLLIAQRLEGLTIRKIIVVKDRIVNIVAA